MGNNLSLFMNKISEELDLAGGEVNSRVYKDIEKIIVEMEEVLECYQVELTSVVTDTIHNRIECVFSSVACLGFSSMKYKELTRGLSCVSNVSFTSNKECVEMILSFNNIFL